MSAAARHLRSGSHPNFCRQVTPPVSLRFVEHRHAIRWTEFRTGISAIISNHCAINKAYHRHMETLYTVRFRKGVLLCLTPRDAGEPCRVVGVANGMTAGRTESCFEHILPNVMLPLAPAIARPCVALQTLQPPFILRDRERRATRTTTTPDWSRCRGRGRRWRRRGRRRRSRRYQVQYTVPGTCRTCALARPSCYSSHQCGDC